jgi:hypothetical protein
MFRNKKSAPQLTFDFDDSSNFPGLPTKISASASSRKPKSPAHSTKSASLSITMSKFNVVRREMQAKFEADLKEFKEKLIVKLEHDIAGTAVKSSVATAMEGINATINTSLQDKNKFFYANMQSERNTITETMTTAVSKKMDLSIGIAVTRALTNFRISERRSSPRNKSPARKKRISSPTPGETADKDNVKMHDGTKVR